MNFETLNLRPELMQAIAELGYETPTPIQERAIPALIAGRDVLGQAQTGTGKTAAFAFPLLEKADEMLKMGFIDDVETILKTTPDTRQTALFSATLPTEIRRLAKKYMHDAETVAIEHKTLTVAQTEQRYYVVDDGAKLAAVARLLEVEDISSALIFVRTKLGAAQLADDLLSRGFAVEALHGDMAQDARETVMKRFRRGQISALVATDVAARGLDI